MRIAVRYDSSVVVTLPRGVSENIAERFLVEKAEWVLKKINFFDQIGCSPVSKLTREDYLKNKEKALKIISDRVEVLNQFYGFGFNKICIKNQKTRWGSCSARGNLNFNYKIIFLPDKLRDYIVVHELCHLGELNHSRKFWNLVAKTFPDYREIRKELKKAGGFVG